MYSNKDNKKIYAKPEFINITLLVTYLILIILKLTFSIISNSIALRADAFDNLNDIVMYATAMVGFILVRKKPNKQYPYGYYKIENIISLFFALFIFFNAYNIFIESISSIIAFINGNPISLEISYDLFLFLIISILISSFMTIYLKLVIKKANIPIIETEANEKKIDVLISTSVLVGVIGAFFNFYLLDPILGLFITIFIVKGGYDVFISSMRTLLDAVVEFNERTDLHDLINNYPSIKEVENIEIRSYGRYIFLEVNVSLNENIPQFKVDNLKSNLALKLNPSFLKFLK